jgi:4-hydroxy-3-methylbut-2-enyl diphosphate reductase
MRRTLERQQCPVSGVLPGEVLVVSSFTHPVRGVVRCPAAPVAAGAMRAAGLRPRHGPAPTAGGGGTLHSVSYLDPSGWAVGLGVAAHRDDPHALRMAEAVVREWAAVMRTRRVLIAATGPSCAGLRREAAMIAQVAGPVHVLAADRRDDVPFRWAGRNVRAIARLADVPDGGTVVLPAHGVDRQTSAAAEHAAAERGVRVLDATCPLVARTHATTRRFADDGATVVVIGAAGHVAVPPIVGQATDTLLVTSAGEVDELAVEDPERVAFVVSPGLAVEDAAVVAARLRARFGRPLGQHPDEFCAAASDRRAAVRAVASCSDLTLVLGDPADPDTRALVTDATAVGGAVTSLDDVGHLRPAQLGPAASIGVVVGTSAHQGLADEVIGALSGLGPVSVSRRHVTTEVQQAVPALPDVRRAG